MEKNKIVVRLLLITLFISFSFPTKTFADSNQSGSNVGISFENDYIPSNNNQGQSTNNGKTNYPNMGEVASKSIPYIGITFILLVIYIYFRNRRNVDGN